MAKIDPNRLAGYHQLHEKTKGFLRSNNEQIHAFLERASREGFELDQFHFRQFPGFFGAPNTRDLTNVDIACIGIPLENSLPNFPGTRWGPKAVRKWSHCSAGPIHHITNVIPFELCNIIDYGDIDFSGFDLMPRINDIFDMFMEFHRRGINTLTVGGEHTMTYPILKALGSDEPLAMIHIDAHADTGGEWGGDSVTDASAMRHAVLDGVLDPERTIQIGIRGRASFLWDFSHESGMRVLTTEEFQKRGVSDVVAEARQIVGEGPCYLTIDADAIDPIDFPGVGLPEPFGLRAQEVRDFIRELRGLNIIGADIAEICPPQDPLEVSANIGANLCFEMLCLLAEGRVARSGKTRKTHWNTTDQ